MKTRTKLLVAAALMIAAHNVPSQGFYSGGHYTPQIQSAPNYGTPYGSHQPYQSTSPRSVTHSQPNIYGGENFYGLGGYKGHSQPNIYGGRDFYWND